MTTKLLIQADDFGLCTEVNQAIEKLFNEDKIGSASVMPPCPGFQHAIELAKINPHWQLGIHLTLTCEYPHAPWRPLSPAHKVSSLVNNDGFFYSDPKIVCQQAKLDELELELRNQIESVLSLGMTPTHIDTHMFVCFEDTGLFSLYLKLAEDYGLDAFVSSEYIDWRFGQKCLNNLKGDTSTAYASYMLLPQHLKKFHSTKTAYTQLLASCDKEAAVLLMHPALPSTHLATLCGQDKAYGASWRYSDYLFLANLDAEHLKASYDIELCDWRNLTATARKKEEAKKPNRFYA